MQLFYEFADEFFHTFKSLTSAEAKLLLVSEKEAYDALRLFGEAVVGFRRTYYVNNNSMTEQKMSDDKTKIKKLREDFFEIIGESYQTKFT